MPELPEVEVVKRSLEKSIKKLRLKKVIINNNSLRYKIYQKTFNPIINKKILSIKRRSKYLLINFSKNSTLVVHLGMTGKFFVYNKSKICKTSFYYHTKSKDKKHDHVIFYFNKDTNLIYNDVRRFGFIKICQTNLIYENQHLKHLGPEPLSKKFNLKYFKVYILNKKKNLKDILMDQRFVSGLGNIYVNEILFLSKLNPGKSVKKLSESNIKKIIQHTKSILKKSILLGGSSIKNFSNSDGKSGSYQQRFSVYGRKDEKCLKQECLGFIRKTVISNRASFYCDRCQK